MARDHDYLCVTFLFVYLLQHLHAVHLRHLDIAEYNVEVFFLIFFKPFNTMFCQLHFEFFIFKDLFQGIADASFVVYNQYIYHNQMFGFRCPPVRR